MGTRSADYEYLTALSALDSPAIRRIGELKLRCPSSVGVGATAIVMGLAAMKYVPRPSREKFFLDSPLS